MRQGGESAPLSSYVPSLGGAAQLAQRPALPLACPGDALRLPPLILCPPLPQADSVVMSKLACASGLYCLEQGRYKAAALKFTEVTPQPHPSPPPPDPLCVPLLRLVDTRPAAAGYHDAVVHVAPRSHAREAPI